MFSAYELLRSIGSLTDQNGRLSGGPQSWPMGCAGVDVLQSTE